jgi:hypothetical protein
MLGNFEITPGSLGGVGAGVSYRNYEILYAIKLAAFGLRRLAKFRTIEVLEAALLTSSNFV